MTHSILRRASYQVNFETSNIEETSNLMAVHHVWAVRAGLDRWGNGLASRLNKGRH